MATKTKTVLTGSLSYKESMKSLMIIGSLFFMFGFVSWINSILIPYFKIGFELSHIESYLVAFSFYISYLIFSVPSGIILKRVGFKKGMMIGFWSMAFGALIFVPAAKAMLYPLFLFGLLCIGAGVAMLQTAANPYVTILGPMERAAQRMSVMGIFNKGAGILAPLIFAAVILRKSDEQLFSDLPYMAEADKTAALAELIHRVVVPYAFVGIILLILGLLIRFSPLPEIDTEHETEEVKAANKNKTNIFQFPHLILGVVAWFLHVGTQVVSIDTIISYAETMNLNLAQAKAFPAYVLTATMIGYIFAIICIPKYISQKVALRIGAILGFIFTIFIVVTHGSVVIFGHQTDWSIWFVVMLGLANSLVGPAIWPLALDGLGRFTKIGSSILVMGLSGNALLPMIYGVMADGYSERLAYIILIPCYLYILYYGTLGYKIRKWK
jgi:glucose/galactose transporter